MRCIMNSRQHFCTLAGALLTATWLAQADPPNPLPKAPVKLFTPAAEHSTIGKSARRGVIRSRAVGLGLDLRTLGTNTPIALELFDDDTFTGVITHKQIHSPEMVS